MLEYLRMRGRNRLFIYGVFVVVIAFTSLAESLGLTWLELAAIVAGLIFAFAAIVLLFAGLWPGEDKAPVWAAFAAGFVPAAPALACFASVAHHTPLVTLGLSAPQTFLAGILLYVVAGMATTLARPEVASD